MELGKGRITVCAKCLQASCWQGEFMCHGSRDAGTVQKSIDELAQLHLEHPSWWDIDENTGCAKRLNKGGCV